eukprot:TRINITY_DN32747_c0_g1_i1.p1 TRINITY_DN32747_c0_g1~~TRINITY_DN32747_c0_g1_i1.p1  ORF type:complete len:524 (+),score=128.76 TRINITY_DN32747_c0_g1_i1:93-1664(+)
MMAALKRISDLESSVLYLESRNTDLESQFEKSRKISEQLVGRLELVESWLRLKENEKDNEEDTKNPNDEIKTLKEMFLEVLTNCESFECRVSMLELKSKDYNDSLRTLKSEQTNLEGKLSKAAKQLDAAGENIKENSNKASQHFVQEVEKLEDKLKILLEEKLNTLSKCPVQSIDQKAVQSKLTQDFQGSPIRQAPTSYHLQATPMYPQAQQLIHFQPNFYNQYPQSFPANIVPGVPYPVQLPQEPQTVAAPVVKDDLTESIVVVKEEDYDKLIGREGKTINRIREESKATIIIKEKIGYNTQPNKYFEVVYKGTRRQVDKAKELASNVLQQDGTLAKNNKQVDDGAGKEDAVQDFKFYMGVRVECKVKNEKDCACKIHHYVPSQNDIMLKVDLNETLFGKQVIRNVQESLGLNRDLFHSNSQKGVCKSTLYKGSFLSCEFEVSLDERETATLQTNFKNLCKKVIENEDQEFPELNEPEEIKNHKLNLTSMKFLNNNENILKKTVNLDRTSISTQSPLYSLPQ